ncbi:hypothetical protein HXX76_002373 [Chlamydomonas incerta]|uniref:Uncharacterized protein n=1 Tax=Chlamydomonas incerta TaxID=51695 RepID=A0A835W6E7_CHLIN|nr:hypothetical protein HXX76_002373 [Chlamydomonas incerta]|eukprot:KAG2442287.1 hypothetical protein HXX76_002373 [Chlamydomonas incerta]
MGDVEGDELPRGSSPMTIVAGAMTEDATSRDSTGDPDTEQPEAEQATAEGTCPATNRIWQQLTPDLSERVASFLPASELAATLRLVCRAAASQFKGSRLRLSQPGGLPHHAFAWRWGPASSSVHSACSRKPMGLQSCGIRSLTLTSRRRLLELTAAGGDVCNLALAASMAGCALQPCTMEAALEGGHLAAATWLLDKGCQMEPCNMVERCAKGGSVQTLQWVLAQRETMGLGATIYQHLPAALQAAARAGHGEVCTVLTGWIAGMAAEGNTRAAELIASGMWHLARRMAPVEAAAGGHARLMQALLAGVPTAEVGADWQYGLLKAVACGCDLATLRKVHAVVCAPLRRPRGGPTQLRAPAGQAAAGGRGGGRGGRGPGGGPQHDAQFEREHQRQEQEFRARQAHMDALGAAARSSAPDWKAKVEWLLSAMERGTDGSSSVNVCVDGAAALPDAEERLRWLQAQGLLVGRQALPEAMRQCREMAVETLRYLLQAVPPQDRSLLRTHLPRAAVAGRLDLLQELLEAVSSPPSPAPGQQAEQQQADPAPLAEVAHGDAAAMGAAAAVADVGGGVAAVKPRWPSVSLDTVRQLLLAAAPEGHLEMVRWLLALAQQSLPKEEQPEEGAAAVAGADAGADDDYSPPPLVRAGVLDAALFCEAVRSGSVPLLELLRGAGCPWHPPAVWEAAASTGCCDMLHWLGVQGCQLPPNDEPFLRAARNADELTIHMLRDLGCAWTPETLARAVTDGYCCVPLAGLVALAAAGCPANWSTLLQLAQRHRSYGRRRGQESEVVAWVRERLKHEQRQAELAEVRRAASKKGKGGTGGGEGGVDRNGDASGDAQGGAKGRERNGRKGRRGRGRRRGAGDSSEDEYEAQPGVAAAGEHALARNP